MRQTVLSGSVRAFYLNREDLIDKLREISRKASEVFPEIREIRLFGSLAKGEETGLSDIDIFLLVESGECNPLERIKPYFRFFSDILNIAVDIIVALPEEVNNFRDLLKNSIPMYKR